MPEKADAFTRLSKQALMMLPEGMAPADTALQQVFYYYHPIRKRLKKCGTYGVILRTLKTYFQPSYSMTLRSTDQTL